MVDYKKATDFMHKFGTSKEMTDSFLDVISDIQEQVMKESHKKLIQTLESLKPKH